MSSDPRFAIDIFSIFKDRLWLAGWFFNGAKPVRSIKLRGPGIPDGEVHLPSYGTLSSHDVEKVHGEAAAKVRFDESCNIDVQSFSPDRCELVVTYEDGDDFTVSGLGMPRNQRAPNLAAVFSKSLALNPSGCLLEVGSRARSGITRRDLCPAGWSYAGLDIAAGPNVDKVGDAHELGALFPSQRFDAVMGFSVLEHLLMPWKFVIELNSILNIGALGLFTTHQCWPIHDAPWDFWRFSDQAWHGLLNTGTGFEIIEASMGEPAFVVAQRCHGVTNFGMTQGGSLASNVLFRKIGPTTLKWDVKVADIVATNYPKGEVSTVLT